LARQIEADKGADIYLSADEQWMNDLQSHDLIDTSTRVDLLRNHLVLIAPKDSKISVTIVPNFPLLQALSGGRLAVAETQSVPAGRYAREALTKLGVWDSVADHLAPAENVRVAMSYVTRGEAPLGVVYQTDAGVESGVRIVATFPEDSHAPILYPAALIKGAKPEAKRFLEYIRGAEAKAVFVKFGFEPLAK
jgi:molybdate transport system substrate-binding protein